MKDEEKTGLKFYRCIKLLTWPQHLTDPLIGTILPGEKWLIFIQPDQNSHFSKLKIQGKHEKFKSRIFTPSL